MDEIFDFFNAALADNRLTRSEAKALLECLKEAGPSFRELNVLRAKLFDVVSNKMNARNHHELLLFVEESVKLFMRVLKPTGEAVITRCYFSPGDDCRNAVIERLEKARRNANICVFTISDDRISRAVMAAHKRGVKISIITDNDKMLDRGSDISLLHQAGIGTYIDKTDDHMHHKFATIDTVWALSGSFNWTRSASRSNHEDLTVTNAPDVVNAFNEEFQRILPQMIRL